MNKFSLKHKIDELININSINSINSDEIKELCKKYITLFDLVITNDEYDYYYFYTIWDNQSLLEEYSSNKHVSIFNKELAVQELKTLYTSEKNSIEIPKIVHLIYLNQRPLQKYNYTCIKSIIKYMPGYKIIIHNDIEPETEEWISIKKICEINKIERVKKYKDLTIDHVQYEADIIRLEMLYKYGGIYMDTDILLLKDCSELFTNGVYYCKENEENMINCVLASNKENEFIKILLDSFDTGLRMCNWAWHIRDMPKLILGRNPHYFYKYNIKLLNYKLFCSIHWTQDYLLNDPNFQPDEEVYGIHLCETILGPKIENCLLLQHV